VGIGHRSQNVGAGDNAHRPILGVDDDYAVDLGVKHPLRQVSNGHLASSRDNIRRHVAAYLVVVQHLRDRDLPRAMVLTFLANAPAV